MSKYTKNLVWIAVETIIPEYKIVIESNISLLNLPESLEDAAVMMFLNSDNIGFKLNSDIQYSGLIVKTMLEELKTDGFMTFGDIDKFW